MRYVIVDMFKWADQQHALQVIPDGRPQEGGFEWQFGSRCWRDPSSCGRKDQPPTHCPTPQTSACQPNEAASDRWCSCCVVWLYVRKHKCLFSIPPWETVILSISALLSFYLAAFSFVIWLLMPYFVLVELYSQSFILLLKISLILQPYLFQLFLKETKTWHIKRIHHRNKNCWTFTAYGHQTAETTVLCLTNPLQNNLHESLPWTLAYVVKLMCVLKQIVHS